MKRFAALDGLRGVSALFVVVFHMNWLDSFTGHPFARGSFLFVEFFFVLSGFVLAHGYGFKENLSFTHYMKARFFRLYPLHLAMFLCIILYQFIHMAVNHYTGINFGIEPFTAKYDVHEIIPNLLLIQSWFPMFNNVSFNGSSWSISIEFYMYALLFATLVTFKSYRILSWLLLSFVSFILIYLDLEIVPNSILRGLSCFFGGSVIYVIYQKLSHIKPSYKVATLIESALILSVILVIQSKSDYRPIFASCTFFIAVSDNQRHAGI